MRLYKPVTDIDIRKHIWRWRAKIIIIVTISWARAKELLWMEISGLVISFEYSMYTTVSQIQGQPKFHLGTLKILVLEGNIVCVLCGFLVLDCNIAYTLECLVLDCYLACTLNIWSLIATLLYSEHLVLDCNIAVL